MICLCTFLEPITVLKTPLPHGKAYRLDGESGQAGKNDMRLAVGLGTCHTCDYCMEHDDSVVFVEDTYLTDSVKSLKAKYPYLEEAQQWAVIRRILRDEHRLKVYGSLLVLCQLAKTCEDAKTLLNGREFKLWIVIPDNVTSEEARVFDHFLGELNGALKIVTKIQILRLDDFRKQLSISS